MNPTGQVFTREELTPLVDLMNNYGRERKVILWCDEILADMAYEGFESSLGLGYERLVVADSPSKAFNVSSEMPGYTIIQN
jgi:bifunctional pyridoxal-dependent enzyme with beta-cystathionase and maltose regulon repressor activities